MGTIGQISDTPMLHKGGAITRTGIEHLIESAPLKEPTQPREPKPREPYDPIDAHSDYFETIEFDPPPSFGWPPFRPWKRDGGLG